MAFLGRKDYGLKMQAVVFDMDGVLFDTERISVESWLKVAGAKKLDRMKEVVTECIGRNKTDICQYMRASYGEDFPAEEFLLETSRVSNETLEREGLPLMKGVRELLVYLKENGIKIGLASSTRKERILEHLKTSGLTEYFEVIIGGDMVLHSKPDPEIYQLACKLLGVDPENAMALEDSPNGIRSAAAAGMQAVMVPDYVAPTPEMEELCTMICKDLFEVLERIRQAQKV